jgi:hypothetical protein
MTGRWALSGMVLGDTRERRMLCLFSCLGRLGFSGGDNAVDWTGWSFFSLGLVFFWWIFENERQRDNASLRFTISTSTVTFQYEDSPESDIAVYIICCAML